MTLIVGLVSAVPRATRCFGNQIHFSSLDDTVPVVLYLLSWVRHQNFRATPCVGSSWLDETSTFSAQGLRNDVSFLDQQCTKSRTDVILHLIYHYQSLIGLIVHSAHCWLEMSSSSRNLSDLRLSIWMQFIGIQYTKLKGVFIHNCISFTVIYLLTFNIQCRSTAVRA